MLLKNRTMWDITHGAGFPSSIFHQRFSFGVATVLP